MLPLDRGPILDEILNPPLLAHNVLASKRLSGSCSYNNISTEREREENKSKIKYLSMRNSLGLPPTCLSSPFPFCYQFPISLQGVAINWYQRHWFPNTFLLGRFGTRFGLELQTKPYLSVVIRFASSLPTAKAWLDLELPAPHDHLPICNAIMAPWTPTSNSSSTSCWSDSATWSSSWTSALPSRSHGSIRSFS